MTSLSSFHSLNSISFIYKPSAAAHPHNIPAVRSSLPSLHSQANGCWSCRRPAAQKSTVQRINSVAEDTQIPESSGAEEEEVFSDQSFSVPVSPSDKLIMYFLADGVIDEKDIPTVSKALEGTEGISDLKFGVSEGIASIQLVKQTTIQATGVASDLVAIIQGSGFKLNTLNLSFDDDE
ncbi:hypothetical protein Dimus_011295 [Dionaea muscipula]